MAKPIEDQIHQCLIQREEERYRKLKSEGRQVKRKAIAKPWKRLCKDALCQEPELLIYVSDYDYNLNDLGFQNYCKTRGILYLAGMPGSRRWEFFLDHSKTKNEYINDVYFQFAQEVNGERYKYTQNEMEYGWKTILIGRAKLQDCWEIYTITVHSNIDSNTK